MNIKHHNKNNHLTKNHNTNNSTQILEYNELQLLLEEFKNREPYHYYLVFLIAHSGLRISEALALQWKDIDFEDRIITVERGFSRGRATELMCKGREIDISENLIQILKEFYELSKDKMKDGHESWLFLYSNGPGRWLFLNPKGDPIKRLDNWRKRVFIPIAEIVEKKIKDEKNKTIKIRPHMLRHTFARMLIDQGADPKYVSMQLGHQGVKTTLDIYSHFLKRKGGQSG